MTGSDVKPSTQNRLRWKGRQFADQEQKDFLRDVLSQRHISKDALAHGLYHRPVQSEKGGACGFAQGKRTISGTLRRVGRTLPLIITGHIILLPQGVKVCGKFFTGV